VPRRKTAFFLFWAGELTYPIYLVHASVLISVQLGMPHQNYAAKWAVATVLTILICWILHMTVQETVLNWRRRQLAKTEKSMGPEPRQGMTRLVGHMAKPLVPTE
jgi:peptidoglycan/LPS O-acetylase OafA/YrhL